MEKLYVFSLPFSPQKLTPRLEKIFERDDIIVCMTEPIKAPQRNLPVLTHVLSVYKLWQGYQNDFPKNLRYTLGGKIDSTFLNILECLFIASYESKNDKLPTILLAIRKTDLLKFFLQVSWELNALDNKKYILISEKLNEIGRMIGGWKRGIESKTP